MVPPSTVAARHEQTETFEYDVFVSYSRKDKAFAWPFAAALAAWKPPAALAGGRPLRVCLDRDDLHGSDYHAAVSERLAASRKLVVICSPHARASVYVNDEIRSFARLRGAQHVISVLFAGLPNNEAAADADKAFPEALYEFLTMPLAASYSGFHAQRDRFRGGIYYGSWYHVVAEILDADRKDVEERDRRRRARVRNMVTAAAVSLVLVLSVLTAWALVERMRAEHRRRVSVAGRIAAESRLGTDRQQEAAEGRALMAAEAVRLLLDLGEDTTDAAAALREALAPLPRRVLRLDAAPAALWFSPDGLSVTAGSGAGVTTFSLADGRATGHLDGPGAVTALFGSPDGRRLGAIDTAGALHTWTDGRPDVTPLPPSPGRTLCAAWSADGRHAALLTTPSADAAGVRLHVLETDARTVIVDRRFHILRPVLLPEQGSCLTFAEGIVLARLRTGEQDVPSLSAFGVTWPSGAAVGPWTDLADAAVGPDGASVTVAARGRIAPSPIVTVVDGASALLDAGRQVVWENHTEDPIVPLMRSTVFNIAWRGDTAPVAAIPESGASLWTRDGAAHVATVSGRNVRVWQVQGGEEVARVRSGDDVRAVLFGSSGRHIGVAGAGGQIDVWDLAHPSEMFRQRGAGRAAALPDGRVAVVSSGAIVLTDGKTGVVAGRWPVEADSGDVETDREGRLIAVATPAARDRFAPHPRQVVVIDPRLSAPVLELKGAHAAVLSPEGSVVFSAGPDGVRATSTTSSQTRWTRTVEGAPAAHLAVSPDGRWLACLAGSTAIVLRTDDGLEVLRREGRDPHAPVFDSRWLRAVAFSPDSSAVASAGAEGVVEILRVPGGETIRSVQSPPAFGDVQSVAFTPDGHRLAVLAGNYASLGFPGAGTYTEQALFIWEIATGRLVGRLPAGDDTEHDFTARIRSEEALYLASPGVTRGGSHFAATVFPSLRYYQTVPADRVAADLVVWNIGGPAPREVLRVRGTTGEAWVDSSPDGRVLITRSTGYVRAWSLDARHLLDTACARLTRNLTPREWRERISRTDPYRKACAGLPVPEEQ